ncbi:MAG: tetratricopeptide repeat protein [Chlorobi bacterium]|nr:tetratricopeptide repeat protein [Chlorobiota bacterium]
MTKKSVIILFIILANTSYAQKNDIDSLKNIIATANNDSAKISSCIKVAVSFAIINKPDSASEYLNKAEKLSKKLISSKNQKKSATGLLLMSSVFYNKGKIYYKFSKTSKIENSLKKALEYTEHALKKAKDTNIINRANIIRAKVFTELTNFYIDKGYFSIALDNALKSQKITDNLIKKGVFDEKESAAQYFYLGLINFYLKNYEKALSYYRKSLQISEKYNYREGIIDCSNNIGIIETELNRTDTALSYFNNILNYLKNNKDPLTEAQTYDNMADCYIKLKDYKKAELYLAKAMIITRKHDIKQGEIYISLGLAELYKETGKPKKAFRYAKEALAAAEETEAVPLIKEAYLTMSQLYENNHNYKKALLYHKKYKELEDSLFSVEKNRQIQESEAKYLAEKKQEEINKQKIELARKNAEIKIKRNQNYIFAVVVFFLFVIIFFIIKTLKNKQKTALLIQKQNKKITDSIEYAEKIQQAALPSDKVLSQLFKEYFILFKPLQIVSGDFYWAVQKDNFILFAAADCTGHGIPGAFVSMLGISFLNELTLISDLTRPDIILEEMRNILKKSFRQTGKDDEQTDGIDIALCSVNTDTDELYFSGANNPAFLVRNGKITELEPVPNPVGVYYKEINFKVQKIKLEKNDVLYLFTDGYSDQFGGEKEKKQKFTLKRFKDLLTEIYKLKADKQKEILEEELIKWQKDTEQTDDILVFGIKF